MGNDTGFTNAQKRYSEAYEVHYKKKNLLEALELYKGVMDEHPDSLEAGYSRSQLLNIVHGTVPAQQLLDSQVKLAVSRLGRQEAAGEGQASVESLPDDTDAGSDGQSR